MRKAVFLILFCLSFALSIQAQKVTQGELEAVNSEGKSIGLVAAQTYGCQCRNLRFPVARPRRAGI